MPRRRFRRPQGFRRYRRLFVIATEGEKTEPRYFALFNNSSAIHVRCLKGRGDSSPEQVLKRMERHLQETELSSSDEAWLVVDRDTWPKEKLQQLYAWSQRSANYGFALSNPKFEWWLLLHFEEGIGAALAAECSWRLRQHVPHYDKDVDARKFTKERVAIAVQRALTRDNPPCIDWPRRPGQTTVYRLVGKLLDA